MNARILPVLTLSLFTTALAPTAEAACDKNLPDGLYRTCAERAMSSMEQDLDDALTAIEQLTDRVDQINDNLMQAQDDIGELSPLLRYITIDEDTDAVRFVGANVFIQSGAGRTDGAVNGLGNLIVGYDEQGDADKTGSHNLIVGSYHGYTSFGGFVAGVSNTVAGEHASVLGGEDNWAMADTSTITGGIDQTTAE